MKKVIVTTLILIVLGTVWTLFLEHEKRRFEESLPKVPILVTQPVNTADVPAASETGESADVADALPEASAIVEEGPAQVEHAHVHSHLHADRLAPLEGTEVSIEELPAEGETPPEAEREESFASFIDSLGMSEAEYERREIATETVRRITNNPKNWVKGRPGEVGFRFVLTGKENREFVEANYILHPSDGNRKALERIRQASSPETVVKNVETIRLEDIRIVTQPKNVDKSYLSAE